LAAFSAQLAEKLGAGWSFEVDWSASGKNVEPGDYRSKPDQSVVQYLIGGMIENDVNKFDEMTVAGINETCGTNKKITLTIGPKTDKYEFGRCTVNVDAGGVRVVFNADYFGCSWDEPWLMRGANKVNNTAAPAGVGGKFTLGELKNIASKRDEEKKAEEAIREKFGAGWSLVIDWASVDLYSRGRDDREKIGTFIIEYIIGAFVEKDLKQMDDFIVEALNEKVDKAKTMRFALGAKDAKYAEYRCNVSIDNKSGVTVTFNADYLQCEYEERNVWNALAKLN